MIILLSVPIMLEINKAMDKSGKKKFTKKEVSGFIIDAFKIIQKDMDKFDMEKAREKEQQEEAIREIEEEEIIKKWKKKLKK